MADPDAQDTVVLLTTPVRHDTVVLPLVQGPAPQPQLPTPTAPRLPWPPPEGRSGVPPFAYAPVRPAAPVGYPVHHNNFAVVGATIGSLALCVSLLPVFGLLSWLLAPLGLLVSAVGLVIGLVRRTGRMGALWGLGTSAAALVVCIGWLLLLLP